MVSEAALEYAACERHVLSLRATGVPDELEDPLLERMDALWLLMTEEERHAAKERALCTR